MIFPVEEITFALNEPELVKCFVVIEGLIAR